MSSSARLLGLALVLVAVPAATAVAALPRPSTRLIVPGRSIGGVTLGGTFASGTRAWGRGGKCTEGTQFHICSYSTADFKDGNAGFTGKPRGRINQIQIALGYDNSNNLNRDTSLTKFHTRKGIGLGDTNAAVRSAYPRAKRRTIPGAANYEWVVSGPGKAITRIQMAGRTSLRVAAIILSSS
jgi:hypothetical protein